MFKKVSWVEQAFAVTLSGIINSNNKFTQSSIVEFQINIYFFNCGIIIKIINAIKILYINLKLLLQRTKQDYLLFKKVQIFSIKIRIEIWLNLLNHIRIINKNGIYKFWCHKPNGNYD